MAGQEFQLGKLFNVVDSHRFFEIITPPEKNVGMFTTRISTHTGLMVSRYVSSSQYVTNRACPQLLISPTQPLVDDCNQKLGTDRQRSLQVTTPIA